MARRLLAMIGCVFGLACRLENMRTFCSSGAVWRMSFINTGISSVTRCTPAAYVPSGAELFTVCP
jgi:hypothetical protein